MVPAGECYGRRRTSLSRRRRHGLSCLHFRLSSRCFRSVVVARATLDARSPPTKIDVARAARPSPSSLPHDAFPFSLSPFRPRPACAAALSEVFATARARRRVWYQVSGDAKLDATFGAHVPVHDGRLVQ